MNEEKRRIANWKKNEEMRKIALCVIVFPLRVPCPIPNNWYQSERGTIHQRVLFISGCHQRVLFISGYYSSAAVISGYYSSAAVISGYYSSAGTIHQRLSSAGCHPNRIRFRRMLQKNMEKMESAGLLVVNTKSLVPLDFHRSSTAVIDRLPVSWSGTVDGIPCSVVISCLTFEGLMHWDSVEGSEDSWVQDSVSGAGCANQWEPIEIEDESLVGFAMTGSVLTVLKLGELQWAF
ncbi:hypothetical protein LXL04_017953 [Taraxacum kok-saghyz]